MVAERFLGTFLPVKIQVRGVGSCLGGSGKTEDRGGKMASVE